MALIACSSDIPNWMKRAKDFLSRSGKFTLTWSVIGCARGVACISETLRLIIDRVVSISEFMHRI